ncbi:MAG: hypothetical protein IJ088_05185 [Clostridia bacterium]|nr:hypothetical protein [Clostridia bacterium]
MQLSSLIRDVIEVVEILQESGNPEIECLIADSRQKNRNGLFFCISGGQVDAHDYAPQAVDNGCVAVVCERPVAVSVPQIVVTDTRAAMTRIAAAFYGHPEKQLRLVGITGTKGKTTTTYLFKSIAEAAGISCGIIGTTGCIAGKT